MIRSIARVAMCVALLVPALSAQQVDRSKRPAAPPPPSFVFPKIETRTLPNGLVVHIVENHALPLVAVRAVIQSGSLIDPAGKAGLFTLDTLLVRDGTTKMSGDDLSSAIDELGAPITPTRFTTVSAQLEPSLTLMADMLMRPTFPADAIERRKAQLTAALQRDEGVSSVIGLRIFNSLLFGGEHPFARVPTTANLAAITRDDIVKFHDTYVRPQNVALVIVGDVTPQAALALVRRAFGDWERKGEVVTASVPTPTGPSATTIYLHDRPKSPQSTVFVGQLGPARTTPDFYALEALGALFGGAAGSRIPQALRERRALTYSVVHTPVWRRADDPIAIFGSSNVDAAKTDSALIVWLSELQDVTGKRAPTEAELTYARSLTVGSLATRIETFDEVANRIALVAQSRLPITYYDDYVRGVNAVTPASVGAAAAKHIDPKRTVIVVVGDRASLEPALKAANIGPVVVVDAGGKPVP
jgi:zinc protease